MGKSRSGADFGEAWEKLKGPAIAHRGLWSPDGAPENSLAAFHAACAGGYGIELDVQLSADGEAMVFHDDQLERMTGEAGRVRDHARADLAKLRLKDTEETIPTLAEALVEIGHRAMVNIELKTAFGDVGPLEARVSEVLIDHNGPVSILGFNPYSHAWFAQHHPQILRGLNSHRWNGEDAQRLAPEQRRAFAALDQLELAKPHYLSLGLDALPHPKAAKLRAGGMPVICWTVRDEAGRAKASEHCDNLIFEGFLA